MSVIGDFNGWEDWYLNRTGDGKFWELFIDGANPGHMYKYKVYHGGNCVEHCDPVGFGMELRPKFASIIRKMDFDFGDLEWMQNRHTWHGDALNIYEVHLGSWRTDPDDENGWFKYEEIAPRLVKYCKEHGYNCIELMPLNEYPRADLQIWHGGRTEEADKHLPQERHRRIDGFRSGAFCGGRIRAGAV